MNSFERLCFNLLGKRMKAKREDYAALRNDLLSARFKTPFEVYISTAYITAIIVGLSGAVVIGLVSWVFRVPKLIKYKGEVPDILVGLINTYTCNRDNSYHDILSSGVWRADLS